MQNQGSGQDRALASHFASLSKSFLVLSCGDAYSETMVAYEVVVVVRTSSKERRRLPAANIIRGRIEATELSEFFLAKSHPSYLIILAHPEGRGHLQLLEETESLVPIIL